MHGSERPSPLPPDACRASDQPRPVSDPFASGTDDVLSEPQPGPEFEATYDSECDAAVCLGDGYIWGGDHIRATGTGGYAHSDCLEEEDARG